ncbi:cytochrome P450 2J6-like [Lineus longissimus]|uniref:cytochrome P450 2J6-like n=1 Tax=Lineus longissimus TaxID=88925 RepID=UPI002B4D628C
MSKKQLPPGPRGVPIFGYLPYIQKEGSFARIAKKYGSALKSNFIFIDAYFAKVVIVNSYDDIKEVFEKREELAAYRTRDNMFTKFHPGHQGLIFANDDMWKKHREFSMSVLRESGICREAVERSIVEELGHLLSAMEATEEGPTYPKQMINEAHHNIMCSLIFGKRYASNDEDFVNLLKYMGTIVAGYGKSLFMKPWMWYLPEFLDILGLKAQQRNVDGLFKFFENKIEECKAEFDPSDIKSFIDAYLLQRQKGTEDFTDFHLSCDLLDLFFGGGETTLATLSWALNYMAKFPEIQTRVQSELDGQIGRDRLPTLKERAELPYTNAVFMEIQRKASVTPHGAFHCNDAEDIEVGDYLIPKGTYVAPNLYAVHHDPGTWLDPENFNPNNFLDEATGELKNVDRLIPFGYGRRTCTGQSVATAELFLLFTGCLQRFTVESTDPAELDGPPVGAIEHPSPYHVRFLKRDKK